MAVGWRQPHRGLPAPAACRAARGSGFKGNLDLADEEISERSERRRPAGENPLKLAGADWHPGHQPSVGGASRRYRLTASPTGPDRGTESGKAGKTGNRPLPDTKPTDQNTEADVKKSPSVDQGSVGGDLAGFAHRLRAGRCQTVPAGLGSAC